MAAPWRSLRRALEERFGPGAIRKVPLQSGEPCPNKHRPGGGCIFCDAYGSGPLLPHPPSFVEQIRAFKSRHPGLRYIPYFQSHANTVGPLALLRERYLQALSEEDVVALYVGTRPDALPDPVVDLLAEVSRQTGHPVTVEIGLQSAHQASLDWLQRRHRVEDASHALLRLKAAGLESVVHLIVGLPGEDDAAVVHTIDWVNRHRPDGVKIHLLHVLKGTRLESVWRAGELELPERGDYIRQVCLMLAHLDPGVVVHRLTGEREGGLYLAPHWGGEKAVILRELEREMRARGWVQGSRWSSPDRV